ncbi:MAG TPA: hypothetical protein DHN33_02930, partial [Eubacteriaceae bacterium]|nr:hypothetical protein [Eubacteriaceae bacterium]
EQALRYYNGKAVVNGINASQESMEKIFPLLARYGGVGVVMAIDEKGAAKTAGERLEVAKKIVRTAETIGIKKRDLIIDCVSLSVLTNPKKAIEALKTLQLVKEELGVTVMLGVGNISYGLSHRVLLDRTYLSMAAAYGLDTLIMNPQQKEIMDEIRAIDLLMNRDPFAQKYEKAFQSSDKEFMESGVDEKSDSKKILALFEKYRNGMLSLAQFIHGIEELKRNRSIREETFKESAVFLHLDGDDYSVTAEVSAVLLDSLGFETKVFDEEILLSNEEELWESSLLILSANLFSKAQKAETIAKKAKARNPKLKILTSGFAFHQDTERDWADEHIQEPGDLLSFVKKYKDK